MKTRVLLTGLFALSIAACGGGEGMGDNNNNNDTGGPDAGEQQGTWTTLIDADWTVSAGNETYFCARRTVTEDMYITGFRAIDPVGTHHTVVTVQDPNGADGTFPCSVNQLAPEMIFASGVGTDELTFPEGVAFKVAAGRQILLNLHLYNVADSTINGTSGTEVQLVPASEVEVEAEVTFAGTFNIYLPGMQETTLSGTCTFDQDATLMTVWPHMHQMGRHMKVSHLGSGNGAVLHDKSFDFNEQLNYPIEPVSVKAGDKIKVDCTWMNTGSTPITFGDSSDAEMCFAGLYRYPKSGQDVFCVDGNSF